MQVSIIIPTYNYGHYIGRAIESVIKQNYPADKIEIIVVDDGSTDNTAEIVADLQKLHPLLQYHPQQNAGKAAATCRGIEMATGDIIFTLDADDWFLPEKMNDTIRVFQQLPLVVHVATAAYIQWADGRKPTTEAIPEILLNKANNGKEILHYFFENNKLFGGGSTYAVRAAVAKKFAWQAAIDMYTDEWLVIQALLAGDTYFLPEPRSVWYVHGSNYSGAGGELLAKKNERLKASSAAILTLLQQPIYPSWLLKAYTLKHAVRCMVWLEKEKRKTLAHAWHFMKLSMLSGHYTLRMLRAYHAFNRLLKW